jgi:xanthine dehydrogenase small subunit
MRRFGSPQVRASGTVGGNIANGSPIGDLAPCLIALGARLELQRGDTRREIALESFFLAYGRQDRSAGEYVRSVRIPSQTADTRFRAFKISKRSDEDISAVLGAFAVTADSQAITSARIAFGGMAGVPKRGLAAEQSLVGAKLDDESTWDSAIAALDADFTPIDDMRASASYRRLVAGNLMRKALTEIAGVPIGATRLAAPRGPSDVA